jgi:hypothetical protein
MHLIEFIEHDVRGSLPMRAVLFVDNATGRSSGRQWKQLRAPGGLDLFAGVAVHWYLHSLCQVSMHFENRNALHLLHLLGHSA